MTEPLVMMPSISNALGMTPLVIGGQESTKVAQSTDPDENLDDDFEIARKNLREVAEQGQLALKTLMIVAGASEEPRAYEVLATMLKTLSETNQALIDLHSKKKKAKGVVAKQEAASSNGVTNNNVFVGTTEDLLRIMHNGNNDDSQRG